VSGSGELAGKAFVVDVQALDVNLQNEAKLKAGGAGGSRRAFWAKIKDLLSEKAVMVGKRKLVPYRTDSFIMLTPLVGVWCGASTVCGCGCECIRHA
jgi:hypothetical protein